MYKKIKQLDSFLLSHSFRKESLMLKKAVINSFNTESLSVLQDHILYGCLKYINDIFTNLKVKIYDRESNFENPTVQNIYDKYISRLIKKEGYIKVHYTLSRVERFLNIKLNGLIDKNPSMGLPINTFERETVIDYNLKDFDESFSKLFKDEDRFGLLKLILKFDEDKKSILDISYDQESNSVLFGISLTSIAKYFFNNLTIADFSLFVSNFKFFELKINNFILQKSVKILQGVSKEKLETGYGFEKDLDYTGDYRRIPILKKEIKFLGKKEKSKRPSNFYPQKINLLSKIFQVIIREFFPKGIYLESFFDFERLLDSEYTKILEIKDQVIQGSAFYQNSKKKQKKLIQDSIDVFFEKVFKDNRVLWYLYTDDSTFNSLWVDVLRNHFIDLMYSVNSGKLTLVDDWVSMHLPFLINDITGNKEFVLDLLKAFDYKMKNQDYIDGRGIADNLYELANVFGVEKFGQSFLYISPYHSKKLDESHNNYFLANHYRNLTRNEDDSSTNIDSVTEKSDGNSF